ncbi:hypothetical protein Zm00014a_041195 [Zea mays]|uniref:Uncharacterized protein n=1 Tax=Zea mays TaxID=4577 RepID=A0A3L6DPZ0_MAIZE|nr:hypothetical protein Zm00014a_041195 [Zea mays]
MTFGRCPTIPDTFPMLKTSSSI